MKQRIVYAVLVLGAALVVGCTSDAGPNVTTEASDAAADGSDAAAAPLIEETLGSARSLVGTTWDFDEAFGLGSANHPRWITFYVVDGELRMDYGSDCGPATTTYVPTVDGLRYLGISDRAGRSTCADLDSFFGYQVDSDIDDQGRLVLRESNRQNPAAVRFTHVQSTSIQSDVLPEETEGERTAILIGRSRWLVTEATGVVAGSDLEQSVGFVSVAGNADVVSFFAGCKGDSREISWNDDASFTVGGNFQFETSGMAEPCTDERTGLAQSGVLAGRIGVDREDASSLALSGEVSGEPWSVRLVLDAPSSRFDDCFDVSVGSVVDTRFEGTEVLASGSETSVELDGFDVAYVETFTGDWDGDGEYEVGKRVTLRTEETQLSIDVVRLCGLRQPVDDLVRIHPNRITGNSLGSVDGVLQLDLVESGSFRQAAFDVSAGSWSVAEERPIDPDFMGPVTLTNKPLDSDAAGDLVNGVIRIRSFGCVSISGAGNTAGLVFPLGRTQWDAANTAIIVDGVSYSNGDRIGLRRLPRPEFLDYFDPKERSSGCGINNHVVAEMWKL